MKVTLAALYRLRDSLREQIEQWREYGPGRVPEDTATHHAAMEELEARLDATERLIAQRER